MTINGKLENAQNNTLRISLLGFLLDTLEDQEMEDSEQILSLSSSMLDVHFNLLIEWGFIKTLRYENEILGYKITDKGREFLKDLRSRNSIN